MRLPADWSSILPAISQKCQVHPAASSRAISEIMQEYPEANYILRIWRCSTASNLRATRERVRAPATPNNVLIGNRPAHRSHRSHRPTAHGPRPTGPPAHRSHGPPVHRSTGPPVPRGPLLDVFVDSLRSARGRRQLLCAYPAVIVGHFR